MWPPIHPATGKFIFGNQQIQAALRDVDFNLVTFLDQSNQSAYKCLRGDMPDTGTSRRTRKAPVRDHGD